MWSRCVLGAVLAWTAAMLVPTGTPAQTPPPGEAAADAAEVAPTWFPASIERREPPFFAGGAFTRLDYHPLEGAREPWRLCAVLPPQDFEYFRALAGGVRAEAARQGVQLDLSAVETFEVEAQVARLEGCLESESDAILVAPVAREGLNAVLGRARARGVPVIEIGRAHV